MTAATTRIEQLRENSNPLFNDRKLKLGTFSSNLSGDMHHFREQTYPLLEQAGLR